MKEWKQSLLQHLAEIEFFARWREENPFKIRAFERALDNLRRLADSELERHLEAESLTKVEGIGKGIAKIIEEFRKCGTSEEWEKLKGEIPLSVMEMSALPGLGVKKIKSLYEGLGIKSMGELAYACQENRLLHLAGFGKKTQENILKSLQELKQRMGKLLLPDALAEAKRLEEKFAPNILFAPIAALGRKDEIIDSLDYLVQSNKKLHPEQPSSSSKEVEFHLKSGTKVRFIFTDLKNFHLQRVFRTSSNEHWKSLQKRAEELGFELSPDFLKSESGKFIEISSEEKLYKTLELPYHPPEFRNWKIEKKSVSLCEFDDLKGVFHIHSQYSDGSHSIEEMMEAAKKLGWTYIGLSEHSRSAFYAHGLEVERLDQYFAEIEQLNKKQTQVRILAGIESDILKDGSLDYPPSILKKFDFIIASIHQRFGMKDMTDRLVKAAENPYTKMLGHLSGRLLLGREAYSYQLEPIVRTCIQNKVAIELNSSPQRLDMDWREVHEACRKGLFIAINPDAHSKDALEDVRYGIWMAKKAGVPPKQIINTWELPKVLDFFGRVSK